MICRKTPPRNYTRKSGILIGKGSERMSVISVNKGNFSSVTDSGKTVLLDFFSESCAPCRMMSPLVEQIAEENPQYSVGKINVAEEPELARRFGVESIPTFVVMRGGEVVRSAVGACPKAQLLELLENRY